MTADTYDDGDQARDAELIAGAWAARHGRNDDPVDACLQHVHDQLVAAAAWDLGPRDQHTDDAADELMNQLRQYLVGVHPGVLIEALILSRWDSAHEQALALHTEARREVDLLEAHVNPLPRRTPTAARGHAVGTATVATCDDPDGHAVEHVDLRGWARHLKLTGLCAVCARIVTRGKRGKRR